MGIAAILLGLLALLFAVLGTFLFGITGLVAALVPAAAAVVLGIVKIRREGKGGSGVFGILSGVLAIILALSLHSTFTTLFTNLHTTALETKPDGLWAQVSEDCSHGFMGLVARLPQDEDTLQALVNELDELNPSTQPQASENP